MQTFHKVSPDAKSEALRLATGGFHVGITSPNEKRPHPTLMSKTPQSKGGVWRATTDLDTIKFWWETCPDGGIFISPRGDFVAIDIDDPQYFEAEVGSLFLQRLLDTFPSTRTTSGGLHIWMQVPSTVAAKSLPRKLSFGETIYEGFYALVPPSTAQAKSGSDGVYVALNPLPDNLSNVPRIEQSDLDQIMFCVAPKSKDVGDGERHDALLSHAIKLGRLGFNATQVTERLWEFNETFAPPYSGQEAKDEISGVMDWVEREIINGADSGDQVSSIKFISMEELANRPTPCWLIPNLIPDSGLGFLIGQPAAGKSFFLQELSQSVCRGVPLFGESDLLPNRTGWVLCLLPEAAPSWGVRTRTYCDYHEVEYDSNFVCCPQPLDLGNKDTWDKLWQAAAEEANRRNEPPALVIVDTLSAAIPGRDENSQADMTPLMAHLQEFVAQGSTVIVAHHPAKHSQKYRGSSVLQGSCDWMISVIKVSGGLREFKSEKLRDVEEITPTAFMLQSHGESAVCIKASGLGPWGLLRDCAKEHPGMLEALLNHGLEVPGEDTRGAKDGDISAEEGVSLKQIKETWRRFDPVQPPFRINQVGYKAADRDRTTALLAVISSMVGAGVLEVVEGRVSKTTRKLDAIVRQSFPSEAA